MCSSFEKITKITFFSRGRVNVKASNLDMVNRLDIIIQEFFFYFVVSLFFRTSSFEKFGILGGIDCANV